MASFFSIPIRILFFGLIVLQGCTTRKFESPPGYDFAEPVTIRLKQGLKEISGICFSGGNDQILSAIEDEQGKIYEIQLPGGEIVSYRFGENGDYEDIASWNDKIFVLKSNGKLTSTSVREKDNTDSVKIYETILPAGEYEGMAIDKNTMYVLCKVCKGFEPSETLRIYRIAINDNGGLSGNGVIEPKIAVNKQGKEKNVKIHPSCLAKNPADNNWYIISSSNKLVMVFDQDFVMKNYYHLDPGIFGQPEGLAFKSNGDMLVSNEGGDGAANIRQFTYKSK